MPDGPLRIALIAHSRDAALLHRMAATLDGEAVVAAAVGPDLSAERRYETWGDMLAAESAHPDRPDVVALAGTIDAAAPLRIIEAGFNLLIDGAGHQPTEVYDHAARIAKGNGAVVGVGFLHMGFPMVRRAIEVVRDGRIGRVRRADATWFASGTPSVTNELAAPAAHVLLTVSGLKLRSVCGDITPRADDEAAMMMRFHGPARGTITCASTPVDEEGLTLRITGSEGWLAWRSAAPEELVVTTRGAARRTVTRAGSESGPVAVEATRLPAGYAEGPIGALANIYRGMYEAVRAKREGRARKGVGRELPTLADATRAARLVEAARESAVAGSTWIDA